jgi:hypothetical protein
MGTSALANKRPSPVTLEVCDGYDRLVDWELLIIDTEAVAVRVGVREEPALQDWVGTWLNAGHSVRRRKCGLFYLREVILWVLIQYDLADRAEREFAMWPYFGQVQDVVAEVFRLLRGHRLLRQVSEPCACET